MTDRKRSPLPEGYQFGDAAPSGRELRVFLARRAQRMADADGVAAWNAARRQRDSEAMARANASDDARDDRIAIRFVKQWDIETPADTGITANVIEGDTH